MSISRANNINDLSLLEKEHGPFKSAYSCEFSEPVT